MILAYGAPGCTWNAQWLPHDPAYVELQYRHEDERGRYRLTDLTGPWRGGKGDSTLPWCGVDPTESGRCWSLPKRGNAALYVAKHVDGWPGSYPTVREGLDALAEHGFISWPGNGGGKPRFKLYLDATLGRAPTDMWTDIGKLEAASKEKMGYPTQKPLALLERIIKASSNEGDVVLDPFCGSGTALVAAHSLSRQWIGIDVSAEAVVLARARTASIQGSFL